MMRRTFLWSVLAFAFVLVMPAQAQEENTSAVLASVGVENITTHQDYNDVTVSFDIANYGESVESDIYYTVELYNTGENKEDQGDDYLVYHENADEALSLPPGQKIHKEVKFIAPEYLGGEHEVWVRIINSSALRLSQMVAQQPLTFAIEGPGMVIDENTCNVFIEGEEENYGLTEGVDVAPEDKLRVACKVNSTQYDAMNVMPHFTTYERSLYGKEIEKRLHTNDITIVPGNEEVIFEIPLTAQPQAYDVGIELQDFEGNQISNAVYAHYVLQGKSATIQNVKFDKGSYDSGEKATIELFWTPSADQFGSDIRRGEGSELSEETKVVLTLTSDGTECASPLTETLTSNQEIFTVDVTANCPNPALALEILDGDQSLTSGSFEAGGEDAQEATTPVEEDTQKSTGTIVLWILGLTIILIVIIVVVRSIKGPKNGMKVLAFLAVAGGMFLMGGGDVEVAHAEPSAWCPDVAVPHRWPTPPYWKNGGTWEYDYDGCTSGQWEEYRDGHTSWDCENKQDDNNGVVKRDISLCSDYNIGASKSVTIGGDANGSFVRDGVTFYTYDSYYSLTVDKDVVCIGDDVTMAYQQRDMWCDNGAGVGGLYIGNADGSIAGTGDGRWLVNYQWGGSRIDDRDDDPSKRTGSTVIEDLPIGKHDIRMFTYDYGGENHSVDEWPIVKTIDVIDCTPAACGTADGTNRTNVPSTNAEKCDVGTASAISNGADSWTWSCTKPTGVPASCSANKIVNGTCGTKHTKYRDSDAKWWTSPGNELVGGTACATGSWVNATNKVGQVNWTCQGNVNGTDAQCYGNRISCTPPVTSVGINPNLILDGDQITATWNKGGADSCTNHWLFTGTTSPRTWVPSFGRNADGTYTQPAPFSALYSMTCTNEGVATDGTSGFGTCSTTHAETVTKCGAGQVIEGGVCKNVGSCAVAYNNKSFNSTENIFGNIICESGTRVAGSTEKLETNPHYWQWQCQGTSGGTVANCQSDLIAECSDTIAHINDDTTFNDSYDASTQPANSDLCKAGTPTALSNVNGRWEWTCKGIASNATTDSSLCFVRYDCPTDRLQCEASDKCIAMESSATKVAILTESGARDVTFDARLEESCDDTFTCEEDATSIGVAPVSGSGIAISLTAPKDPLDTALASSNPINVDLKCSTDGVHIAKGDVNIEFRCQESSCDTSDKCSIGTKAAQDVSECTQECSSDAECANSQGVIKEVQP